MPGEAAHSDIPSHGLNDKKMVEMAAFEERGLLSASYLACHIFSPAPEAYFASVVEQRRYGTTFSR